MSKKNKKRTQSPSKKRSCVFVNSPEFEEWISCEGYTTLDKNPEILRGCSIIANLVSSMTIYLMQNTDKGDRRIKNELSRKIDINPSKYMTRKAWMNAIVMNLLLYGNGNSIVLPITENGLLEELYPVPAGWTSFIPDGLGYKVMINGIQYDPDEVLHFTYNNDRTYPWQGRGMTASIKDVANNLKQAKGTEDAYLKSKWRPPLIIKVDALVDEFSGKEGRQKLLEEYFETQSKDEPWLIPSEQFQVETIRPLSLKDLAINESIEMNKKTVASILGVPNFVLGVGTFSSEEWNNFINSTILPLALGIQQELTRKILISQDWYFKFNINSLYAYDITSLGKLFSDLYTRGITTKNEVRDKLNLDPVDDGDEFVILENFIPASKIGEQLKLLQEGE